MTARKQEPKHPTVNSAPGPFVGGQRWTWLVDRALQVPNTWLEVDLGHPDEAKRAARSIRQTSRATIEVSVAGPMLRWRATT